MANKEIKTRFRLEGEADFKRGIKEAADAIKVLDSEQKLAKAQFEATGDAQQYAAETARILRDKIAEQEKAVAAAEAAMKELREKGVEKNNDAFRKWQTRLNNAKTSLVKMQDQLDKADEDIKETSHNLGEGENAAKGFEEQLENVGKGIDFQNTIAAIDNVKKHIEGIIKAAVKASIGLWNMETDAGKWADDLVTAASKAGIDVETYQSWQYASNIIDTDVSTITGTITRLEKDLGSSNEEMAKSFNSLGIRTRESSGKVRDAEAVFWDVVDALGRVKDDTTRSIYAQKLLGQSWKELNPLIEAGSAAYKKEAEEGRKNAVVSKENVEALVKWNDSQNKLNASLTKAKYDALAALAPTFTQVAEGMGVAVNAFNDFLATKQGQEALEKMNTALSGVISSFLGEDNGKGTFQSIVEGAAGAIETLNGMLDWIAKNGEAVEGIVLGIVGAWTGLTVGKEVLMLLQLLKSIPLAKLNRVFGKNGANLAGEALKGAAESAGGATGNAVAGGAGAALSGLVKSAFSGAGTIVDAALSALGLTGIGVLTGIPIIDYLKNPEKYSKPEAMETYNQLMDAGKKRRSASGYNLIESPEEAEKNGKEDGKAYMTGFEDGLEGKLKEARDAVNLNRGNGKPYEEDAQKLFSALDELTNDKNGIWNKLSENTQDAILEYYNNVVGTDAQLQAALAIVRDILADLDAAGNDAEEAGKGILDGIADGLKDQSKVKKAAEDAAEAAGIDLENAVNNQWKSRFDTGFQMDKMFHLMGENAALELADGIENKLKDAEKAAENLADKTTDAVKNAWDEHSPYRVFAELGENAAISMANGLMNKLSDVQTAARALADIAIAEVEAGMIVISAMVANMGRATSATPVARSTGSSGSAGAVSRGGSGGSGSGGAGYGQTLNATIVMDRKTVGYLVAPVVNETIGAEIQAARG